MLNLGRTPWHMLRIRASTVGSASRGIADRKRIPYWYSRGGPLPPAHRGFYHDATFVKRNNFNLLLHETFGGGFSPTAVLKLRCLARKISLSRMGGATHSRETRELQLAGAVGEGATPCTDGRPSENTPPWTGSHQSSLPNAAEGYPTSRPRETPACKQPEPPPTWGLAGRLQHAILLRIYR